MNPQIPPQDLNWITPYLVVQSVEKALDFYKTVFSFEVHQTLSNNKGKMVFARVRYNGCNVILGPYGLAGEKEFGHPPAVTHTASSTGIYVYCSDVEKRFAVAKAKGVKILIPLEKRFWGDTLFRVEDLDGYIWTFGQPTHAFDPALLPEELS